MDAPHIGARVASSRRFARRMATANGNKAPGVAPARRTARVVARGGRATRIRRRATSASDDDTARATRDATTRMSYDDGEPLIDVRAARANRTGRERAAPPVTRPGILKSKAAALREIDEATRGDEEAAATAGEAESDDGRSRRKRRDGERVELTSTASVVEWMVRSTDDMLDDLEAREPPGAVAAWALSKRAESVVGNPAVKKTVDIVGKVGVAAVRAAAPVVADGAGKVVKEGSKLAVKAAVSAATAKVGYDKREREKERSTPFGGLLGGNKKTPPLESEREKKKNPFAFPSLAKKPEPEPPRGLFGRKKDDKPKRGFFGGK